MGKINFSEVVNIEALEKMAENLYAASGIPIGIIGLDGSIYVSCGWQDICTKFHRVHPETCSRCLESDMYINRHVMEGKYIEYKCLNNMWDIGVPIIIAEEHVATIFMGQFFYEGENIDTDFFRNQARKFGFEEEDYLKALSKVPILSRNRVEHIIEYYLSMVDQFAESGIMLLGYQDAQKELAKSQKYLDTIFNSVNDTIFICDFYGKIIHVNQTAISMFGYTKEEFIGIYLSDIISEKSNLSKLHLLEMFYKARCNGSIILESLCKAKNDNEFWTEFNIGVMKFEEKDEVIVTIRDITDRKLGELALQKEAEEMELLRTEFFANISHELRTPLNIIFGAIQVIAKEIEEEDKPINRHKILNNLSIEKQNCFRLLRLINNLIDSTKLDSGYFELKMVNCNIISIIEEITLSVAEYINSNNLTLVFDTDIEEKVIACDLDKIERIILNLLSNAVKFTPSGGQIFVNIFDGEEYITILVEDTGIGIPHQKLNIIFDRFRQVDKSFARKHEGSGIGLSLVKSLLEMQGGSISVESSYGVGTKFIIKFPVKTIEEENPEESTKNMSSIIEDCVERIKIEFSDIYK